MVKNDSHTQSTHLNLRLKRRGVRMKVAVFASCTEDEITVDGRTSVTQGGPGTYCSIMAHRMRANVELHTRMPHSASARGVLEEEGVSIHGTPASSIMRFALDVHGRERTVRLLDAGESIEYAGGLGVDGAIITPACGEMSQETFGAIKADAPFVFLDPQGFLRRAGADGVITLARTEMDLQGVSAIKADDDELAALTGGKSAGALADAGVEHVLHTSGADISMVSGGREYRLRLPNRSVADTTGVGDMFSASFCVTMLKERDALWAFCFACGAAHAALDTGATGTKKIPSRRSVETSAAYFYNTVEFSSA